MMWLERAQNLRFLRRLRHALALDATVAAAAGLPLPWTPESEARIWRVIDARRRHARPRLGLSVGFVAVGLAVAAVALVLSPSHVSERDDRNQGIKGESPAHVAMITGLRVAAAMPDGQVQPGENGMRVAVGTPLLFSVESHGLSPKRPGRVILEYRSADNVHRLAAVELSKDREIVESGTGYLSFTPTTAATYEFHVRTEGDEAHSPDFFLGVADDVRFVVQVVEP